MSAAKHTPGPWSCDQISEYTGGLLVRAANGDTVARVCCYGPQSETPRAQEANARLIAAAPDMSALLGECRDAIEWCAQECGHREAEALAVRIDALLAAATGASE